MARAIWTGVISFGLVSVPVYFNKAYYLAPGSEETKRTYALLRDALARTNRAGIATFVMHSKEHLAAVRADGDVLVLQTLFFADEVRNPADELDGLPGKVTFKGQELTMATQLIESMSGPWRPKDYRDTYTDQVFDLIEYKRKGKEFTAAADAPAATNVVDLMEALRRSVEAARSGGRTPAKKTSARKATSTRETTSSGKASAGEAAAMPSSARKKAATKTTSAGKQTAATKTPAKKTAAKKTGARKTAVKKTGARKTAAKKAS